MISEGNDKKCIFVDRSCLKDSCVGWQSNNCFIYLLEYPIVKGIIQERIIDLTSIIHNNFEFQRADLDELLNQIEKTIIQKALVQNKGSKTLVARSLNVTVDSLRHRLEKLGLS